MSSAILGATIATKTSVCWPISVRPMQGWEDSEGHFICPTGGLVLERNEPGREHLHSTDAAWESIV
jgi:hypothetical protein